jgi:hypothetical protein
LNRLAACALLCATAVFPLVCSSLAFAQAAAQPGANASSATSPQAAAMMAIDWAAVKPGTQLEVLPADKPGVYELRAVVTDLATGKELMRPRLLTEAGKEARDDAAHCRDGEGGRQLGKHQHRSAPQGRAGSQPAHGAAAALSGWRGTSRKGNF